MTISFSKRTSWDLDDSPLTAAVRRIKQTGGVLVDLTLSNPTACGFGYASAEILGPLEDPRSLHYDPDARGIEAARSAVAAYYSHHGAKIDPERILLTTSTSEAYSYLFRLLCDTGDEVLVAQPSYPLFDFLAALDDVTLRCYPLFFDFGWWIDFAELERRITPQTKAILLVHPNNPTGHSTSTEERRKLEMLCREHALALIVDEVFLDYSLGPPITSFATGEHQCLTFVVSGLSKVAALPQMKVGWLLTLGPAEVCSQAYARLEVIADTFLSVNAPAQHGLSRWLRGSGPVRRQILDRIRINLQALTGANALRFLPVEAGWSAVVAVPQRLGSGSLTQRLIEECGVVTHPASFYGMAGAHRLVVSLIGPEADFRKGIALLDTWCLKKLEEADAQS